MTFNPPWEETRFPARTIVNPFGVLDHNQVIHRRFVPAYKWTHDVEKLGADAWYFKDLADAGHGFYPIDADAAVKRLHAKGMLASRVEYAYGMSGLRE
jgi:hypothetical protein